MSDSNPIFPPPPTPVEMSTLLYGLSSIYNHVDGLQAHLDTLSATLTRIEGKVDALSNVPAPTPADPMAAYLADLERFRARVKAEQPLLNPPQIHGGINTFRIGTDNIGRVYCDQQTNPIVERFVIEAVTAVREASALRYVELAVNPQYDDDRLDDDHDLGTGYNHTDDPASVFSSDSYSYIGVPTEGTGAPPSGVFRRYYKLKRLVGSPPTETDSGELYREWYVNGQGNEVWVDHWVLYPAYLAPDVDNNVELKVEYQSTGIPASAQAFFDDVNEFIDNNPGTYSYCNLVLEWKVFDP